MNKQTVLNRLLSGLSALIKIVLALGMVVHASANANDYAHAQAQIDLGADLSTVYAQKQHPLYPYLALSFLRKHPADPRGAALLKRFSDIPYTSIVRNAWLRKQYELGNYAKVVDTYRPTSNEDIRCAYRSALLQQGKRSQALKDIKSLWMSGNSVSALCDDVFATWPGANKSENLIQRAELAYFAGNTGMVSYLLKKMTTGSHAHEKRTLLKFNDLLKHPEDMLVTPRDELTNTALARRLLPRALAELVRKDSVRYASFALGFDSVLHNDSRYQKLLGTLTGYLANRANAQALYSYQLIESPSSDITQNLVRSFIVRQDWRGLYQHVSSDTDDAMVLYWLARAGEKLGMKQTNSLYAKAAQYRSYYGFLAADRISSRYRFNRESISPQRSAQSEFDNNEGLKRARLLQAEGDSHHALREILHVARSLSQKQAQQLALWLHTHDFHFAAIYLLGKQRDWNDIDIRFPTPYEQEVEYAHQRLGVDMTWIYAILRQESSMNPYAVSRAQAKGLMQLIPKTARSVAQQLGLSLANSAIFDPKVNTQLGAAYLQRMYERFGNIAYASAAYNAGPHRVSQWQPELEPDITLWIERIPFHETRKYVKNILEYQQVYAHRLGKRIPTVTQRLRGDYQALQQR